MTLGWFMYLKANSSHGSGQPISSRTLRHLLVSMLYRSGKSFLMQLFLCLQLQWLCLHFPFEVIWVFSPQQLVDMLLLY
uniref:Uncharacterized protein n=1 Tax=Arundo donax TaxID=35708 RepID=A0A0A9D9X9_ARUDO